MAINISITLWVLALDLRGINYMLDLASAMFFPSESKAALTETCHPLKMGQHLSPRRVKLAFPAYPGRLHPQRAMRAPANSPTTLPRCYLYSSTLGRILDFLLPLLPSQPVTPSWLLWAHDWSPEWEHSATSREPTCWPAWASLPLHFAPHQSIFWRGSIVDMGIWRAGGVVVMGRRWRRFTLCHLTSCLAPHISVEMPVMAKQPYKAGFGFYSESHVWFIWGPHAGLECCSRRENVLNRSLWFCNWEGFLEGLDFLRSFGPYTSLSWRAIFRNSQSSKTSRGNHDRLHPFPGILVLGWPP